MSNNSTFKKNNLTSRYLGGAEGSTGSTSQTLSGVTKKQGNPLLGVHADNHPKESHFFENLGHKSEYEACKLQNKFNSPIRISEKLVKLSQVGDIKPFIPSSESGYSKNKKLSTPSSIRKYSDNCDSNDETKSVSSINTKESQYCQTPKANKSNDFKVKYKTEICKFWDMNKICKFGDNVRL
jgi:hypothetical protein